VIETPKKKKRKPPPSLEPYWKRFDKRVLPNRQAVKGRR
jgi:hypothetical protein